MCGRYSGNGSTWSKCNCIVPKGSLMTVRGHLEVLDRILEVVGGSFRGRWRSIICWKCLVMIFRIFR